MKKTSIDYLSIESTRRCNMKCRHCLRGPAQKIDIKRNYIRDILKQTEYIGNINFSGGEPSLNPKAIKDFTELARQYKTEIGSFYIATNGKEINEAFVIALHKLYNICYDPQDNSLEITRDKFHQEFGDPNTSLLEAFSFIDIRDKDEDINSSRSWINEGRFKRNFPQSHYNNGRAAPQDVFTVEDNYIGDGTLYLNCKGNVIAGCSFSYKSQEKEKNIICTSKESIYDKIQQFKED